MDKDNIKKGSKPTTHDAKPQRQDQIFQSDEVIEATRQPQAHKQRYGDPEAQDSNEADMD